VESTDIDFRALLTKIRASGADLVYGGFVIDSGGPQVIQQMNDIGLFDEDIDFMGPDGLVNPALVEQIGGPDVGNGQIHLTFPGLAPSQLTSEAGLRFFEGFQEAYGYEPSPWSTYAYQSMQVVLHAIEVADSSERADILEAMRGIEEFEGVTGTFGFDENGDPTLTSLGGNLVEDGEINFLGSISPDMNESCDM
jgi:branched-chain amino acid transport system substrate-binding protein